MTATLPARIDTCCGTLMARDYSSVQLAHDAFTPHFNYATGQYVRTKRDFIDALKHGSDANSRATGIDHNYTPVYPGDVPRPTVADDVFETREKALRDGVYPAAPDPAPATVNYDRSLP